MIHRAPIVCMIGMFVASHGIAQVCVECHMEVTPRIVWDWQVSKHTENDVDCSECQRGPARVG